MRYWLCLLLFVLGCAAARPAAAQAIQVDVAAVPLAQALARLSAQTGVDIVYAERLVRGQTATCRYRGSDVERALACVLAETSLQARQLRSRQYVLVAGRMDRPTTPAPRATLAGYVMDAQTGDVLPGAHVVVPGLRVGTTTNDAGYFALPALPATSHRVVVSYLGFAAVDTLVNVLGPAHTFRLRARTLAADEVVVEASTPSEVDLNAVPGAVALPVRDLAALPTLLGEQDLFQALQWMPGVQRAGEAGGGLIVRGGTPDQNLYLLDGAPVYHPWHAFSLISTFQTETFKDIRLYQGAFPAEHGGRLAAVLDAELKDGHRTAPRAVAGLSATSGRFIIESPVTANSSFMLSGRGSYLDKIIGRTHPVEDADGRRDTLRTGYYFYDWSAKVTVRPGPRGRLSFSYYTGRDVLDLRLPFDLSLDVSSWLRPADLFFEVDQRWGNRLLSGRYQYLYTPRFYVTATAYESRYDAREGALIQPTSTSWVASDYGVQLRDLGLKLDADYYATLAHELRFGVQVVQRQFRSALAATVQRTPGVGEDLDEGSRQRAFEAVVYAQDRWRPAPRWQVEPGARLSVFSGGRYVRFNPRFNVRYDVHADRLALRAGVSTQTQYLHRLRDRTAFLYDLVSSRWVPTSEHVRPSQSWQVALGAHSRPHAALELDAQLYWRHASSILLPRDAFGGRDDLVGSGIEIGTLLGEYVAGRARAYGVELDARWTRGRWLVWTNYAGGRSLSRSPALDDARYRPTRFDVPRTVRGLVSRTTEHWTLGVAATLRSGYPLTVPEARYAVGGPLDDAAVQYLYRPEINNGRLPPYFRMDLTVGYRFGWLGARWRTQLNVYNALHYRNVTGRSYYPDPEAVRVEDRYGVPLLPLFEIEMTL